MSSLKKPAGSSSCSEKCPSAEQQRDKVKEVRELLGALAPDLVTDATVRRFLWAKSWNSQKASKAMKEAINWRLNYRPEAIRWEDIAREAGKGKLYMADYLDKQGRPVLVVRPGGERSESAEEQLRCFVYHLEKAVAAMEEQGQTSMVWLADFHGWTLSSTPVADSRACLQILQGCYPGIVGAAVVHSPPRLFQVFWRLLRPFLDDKTYASVKFVYAGDPEGRKVMEDCFHVDAMDEAYGGKNRAGFDADAYGKRMRDQDDSKLPGKEQQQHIN